MRAADIFLSFEGRLDRERWLGAAALFVTLVLATYAATWLLARNGAISFGAREAIRTFVQAPGAVVRPRLEAIPGSRRLRPVGDDLPEPDHRLADPGVALRRSADRCGARGARIGVAWAQLAVALWLAYALAGRAGQEGPNAYGADPRGG